MGILLIIRVVKRLCYSSHSTIIEHMSERVSGPGGGPRDEPDGEPDDAGAAEATPHVVGTDAGALADVPLDSTEIVSLMTSLGRICDASADTDDPVQAEAECIATVRALEELKSAAAAAQARVTARLRARRVAREAADGVPAAKRGAGLAGEVALARRVSPCQGNRHVGLAMALTSEMPCTLADLAAGRISEWKATLVVKETAVLSSADRSQVDRELNGKLEDAGDRRAGALAKAAGYRLDPASAIRRVRGATKDRRVGLRPAPDTMSILTGVLPVAQGVACKIALEQHADQVKQTGDDRTRSQIMADTLVERLTGQTRADKQTIEVGVLMSPETLMGTSSNGDEAAYVNEYGPIPAGLARTLVREADHAWLRRLYTTPHSGELVAMDSRRRVFSGRLRDLIISRDQNCRTPWCDAPIRHIDHAVSHRNGGSTSIANGAGLCAACNYAKEHPGWQHRVTTLPGGDTQLDITTPTGHRHRSRPPTLKPPGDAIEARFDRLVQAA